MSSASQSKIMPKNGKLIPSHLLTVNIEPTEAQRFTSTGGSVLPQKKPFLPLIDAQAAAPFQRKNKSHPRYQILTIRSPKPSLFQSSQSTLSFPTEMSKSIEQGESCHSLPSISASKLLNNDKLQPNEFPFVDEDFIENPKFYSREGYRTNLLFPSVRLSIPQAKEIDSSARDLSKVGLPCKAQYATIENWDVDFTNPDTMSTYFVVMQSIVTREGALIRMYTVAKSLDDQYWKYAYLRIRTIQMRKPTNTERLVSKRKKISALQEELSIAMAHLRSATVNVLDAIAQWRSVSAKVTAINYHLSIFWEEQNYVMKMSDDLMQLMEIPVVRFWLGFEVDAFLCPPTHHAPKEVWLTLQRQKFSVWLDRHHKYLKSERQKRFRDQHEQQLHGTTPPKSPQRLRTHSHRNTLRSKKALLVSDEAVEKERLDEHHFSPERACKELPANSVGNSDNVDVVLHASISFSSLELADARARNSESSIVLAGVGMQTANDAVEMSASDNLAGLLILETDAVEELDGSKEGEWFVSTPTAGTLTQSPTAEEILRGYSISLGSVTDATPPQDEAKVSGGDEERQLVTQVGGMKAESSRMSVDSDGVNRTVAPTTDSPQDGAEERGHDAESAEIAAAAGAAAAAISPIDVNVISESTAFLFELEEPEEEKHDKVHDKHPAMGHQQDRHARFASPAVSPRAAHSSSTSPRAAASAHAASDAVISPPRPSSNELASSDDWKILRSYCSKAWLTSQSECDFWNDMQHSPFVVEAAIGMEDVFPEQMLVPPLPAKLRRRCRVLDGMFAKEFRVYQELQGRIESTVALRSHVTSTANLSVLSSIAQGSRRQQSAMESYVLQTRQQTDSGTVDGSISNFLRSTSSLSYPGAPSGVGVGGSHAVSKSVSGPLGSIFEMTATGHTASEVSLQQLAEQQQKRLTQPVSLDKSKLIEEMEQRVADKRMLTERNGPILSLRPGVQKTKPVDFTSARWQTFFASKIQAVVRGFVARCRIRRRVEQQCRTEAAIMIQKRARMMLARRSMADARKNFTLESMFLRHLILRKNRCAGILTRFVRRKLQMINKRKEADRDKTLKELRASRRLAQRKFDFMFEAAARDKGILHGTETVKDFKRSHHHVEVEHHRHDDGHLLHETIRLTPVKDKILADKTAPPSISPSTPTGDDPVIVKSPDEQEVDKLGMAVTLRSLRPVSASVGPAGAEGNDGLEPLSSPLLSSLFTSEPPSKKIDGDDYGDTCVDCIEEDQAAFDAGDGKLSVADLCDDESSEQLLEEEFEKTLDSMNKSKSHHKTFRAYSSSTDTRRRSRLIPTKPARTAENRDEVRYFAAPQDRAFIRETSPKRPPPQPLLSSTHEAYISPLDKLKLKLKLEREGVKKETPLHVQLEKKGEEDLKFTLRAAFVSK